MERIKRFLKDESGSSEAASSVVLIAGVGSLLAVAILAYYGAISAFFGRAQGWIAGHGF
jgi:Flp pilus assembly pilin Flp